MKQQLLTLITLIALNFSTSAQEISLKSPDNSITINVKTTDKIYYNLLVDNKEVMWFSPVSMSTNQGQLGVNPSLISQSTKTVDEIIKTTWGIRSEVKNNYNELTLSFKGGYSLIFRAFNDGVAYRFQTNLKGELIVYNEEVSYRFLENLNMMNHEVSSFFSSSEELYTHKKISDIRTSTLISLPSLIKARNVYLSVLESDLYNYPGMYLSKKVETFRNNLDAKFPAYPAKTEEKDYSIKVNERANFIAKTVGTRSFPWRVMAISRNDRDLADSDLVYKLARPQQFNSDWVKPGKVSWDWWNALNLSGVDFKTGMNTKTYEYFIDFASKNGIEYITLDEGWSDPFDIFLPTSDIDVEHLVKYAKERNVKIILWAVWHTIDRQYKEAFPLFEKWGIAGVKVDFIERDDQIAVEFYERLTKAAAEHHLLVDYHGCSKPTGLHRTYPNLVNYEAVRGNEYNKIAKEETPQHNVDIAFTRMMAGPLDYTPGAMNNSVEGSFQQNFESPMSHGTRCHQLAMYVVYFAPLQMLCDAPTAYEQYPDILNYLSKVPTTWDETTVLDAKLGEYIVIARKKGNDWYIGGLTNWTEREVELDLSKIISGNYKAQLFTDGVNANRKATEYRYNEKEVSAQSKLKITMKKGGGFAIRLQKL